MTENNVESMGVFYLDDNFLETFSYRDEPNPNIDMSKLDYRQTAKDYHYFKKRYPLFDDEIIELLIELTIQEERKEERKQKVKEIIKPRKPAIEKKAESCVIHFD